MGHQIASAQSESIYQRELTLTTLAACNEVWIEDTYNLGSILCLEY